MYFVHMLQMFKTSIILIAFISNITADDDDGAMENDDKLILKPAELADLVLKERIKTELIKAASYKEHDKIDKPKQHQHDQYDHTDPFLSVDESDISIANVKIEESEDDADTLKNRKVWSRWSKWGVCSVSCGSGFMARRRACMAGLCACGEWEEQRRPCRRTPCPTHTNELE